MLKHHILEVRQHNLNLYFLPTKLPQQQFSSLSKFRWEKIHVRTWQDTKKTLMYFEICEDFIFIDPIYICVFSYAKR